MLAVLPAFFICISYNILISIHTKGVAKSSESNLSRKPPWPGIKLPLSFTLAKRLSLLSNKSPKVPTNAAIEEIPIDSSNT